MTGVQTCALPIFELQIKTSKVLSRGFIFSIVWLAGIGLQARKLINQSDSEISGIKMAWWCIIVGGIGMIAFPLLIIFR